MIAIATTVMQQDCGSVRLSQEQVCAAVTVNISGEQGPRRVQLDCVQTDFSGHISEAVLSQITEQPDFSTSVFCFAHGCQIDPAIVIVIQRGHAPGPPPVFYWKLDLLHTLAVQVAPKCNARRAIVGKGHIHPAVLVKVQSDCCRDRRQTGQIPRLGGVPFSFAGIQKQLRFTGGKDQVNGTIIIEISRSYRGGRGVTGKTERNGDICECVVSIVTPNYIFACFAAGYKEIEVAIMVVVNKHDGQRLSLGMDADTLRYVLERAVALIMKEQDPIIGCNGQVGVTIIIVIGSGAGDGVQLGIEAG